MREKSLDPTSISRRVFLWKSAATAALVSTSVVDVWGAETGTSAGRGPAYYSLPLDQDWLFGGRMKPGSLDPGFVDEAFSRVTLPHCVAPLSWQDWEPSAWDDVWIYRRHFEGPQQAGGLRYFLHFDRVMAGATPVLNGHAFPQHLGGFLPFAYEVTDLLRQGDNLLSVAVDGRWLNAPPSGSPRGPRSIDYLLPGGISGGVSLRAVPQVFIREMFAKPVDVLERGRRVEVSCRIDAGAFPASARLVATLEDKGRTLDRAARSLHLDKADQEVSLTLSKPGNIRLWSPESPYLYDVVVTLFVDDKPLHNFRTRIGFRDARFEVDGFFLNGKRLQLFGLDRHELYPYVGFSAPKRALRKDAEILRRDFHCNMVRCSHYPQSEAFMDACDELGLMVWEEIPGWQYLGDKSWRELALRDLDEMIRRDRNHPSVIIWGVRINESANDPELYRRTREMAKSLDDSRPTSGTMTGASARDWRTEWHQDVFAFDDYHAEGPGVVGIRPPLPGVPYLIAEAVGQFNYNNGRSFNLMYRRTVDVAIQQEQALLHAQAHGKAAGYARCSGLIAWSGFDYGSLMNAYRSVKYPGVADFFRIPKLGASFYLAQVDPKVRPVIEPSFYWDFGPHMPDGPGERAAIFSNCDRLEVLVDGNHHAVLHPDRAGFPHIAYPPFFANLKLAQGRGSELTIRGYVGSELVMTRRFSADTGGDRLMVSADDAELHGDGVDATRVVFRVVDKFGAPRPFAGGKVELKVTGPGMIVGDNPFDLTESGGSGAVWIRSLAGRRGLICMEAQHPSLKSSGMVCIQAV